MFAQLHFWIDNLIWCGIIDFLDPFVCQSGHNFCLESHFDENCIVTYSGKGFVGLKISTYNFKLVYDIPTKMISLLTVVIILGQFQLAKLEICQRNYSDLSIGDKHATYYEGKGVFSSNCPLLKPNTTIPSKYKYYLFGCSPASLNQMFFAVL